MADDDAWGCARCAALNEASSRTCATCDAPRRADFPAAPPRLVAPAPAAPLPHPARAPASGNASSSSPSPSSTTRRRRGVPSSPPPSSWDDFLLKLLHRAVAPATYVFNGTLFGVFALAGACTGAVAGAVAARATHTGVVRGFGVGAVAGAAVSVEALDLARLFLHGHSVAGAMADREGRRAERQMARQRQRARRERGERRVARGRRGGGASDDDDADDADDERARGTRRPGGPGEVSSSFSLEDALVEGDVESILRELVSGRGVSEAEGSDATTRRGTPPERGRVWPIPRRRRPQPREGDVVAESSRGVAGAASGGPLASSGGPLASSGGPLASSDASSASEPSSLASRLHEVLGAILTASRLDNMTYEELLDRFGAGHKGAPPASPDAVARIPTRTLETRDRADVVGKRNAEFFAEDGSSSRCCVCLESYAVGDVVKALPACGHGFHAACVDRWLTGCSDACPVCRERTESKAEDEGEEVGGKDEERVVV